ncbi:amidohydrolase family protein [Saccharopolyspora sp. ASAGF58]|uniref:amidohydrolase family protein n=1 Tax=Saccharopolyspora sp. ASAGF58 TaxID=2719023 RepID=UPI00143FEB00|nr:amidohydrolase family protein [Saccharopolyspora sp. ASAGF58]QIZ37763.1 amidohydrolase [Saccharopolyspora sp. ASAGF58]
MNVPLLQDATNRDALWTGPVVDCDVHATPPSLEALFPYTDPVWVQGAQERGWKGPNGQALAYPPNAPTTARDEWRPDGRPPASRLEDLQQHVLEPWRTEIALVNTAYGVDSLRHPDWAPALARAVNDWLIAEWLDRDPRLVGSMVIPARDPAAAAAEIERVGSHPRIVQVTMPVRSERLYGQRVYWPIYEAMTRHDLVMGLSWGGTTEDAPSPTGYASWYAEEYAAEIQVYGAQLTSLIYEGTFQKFPELRVTMLESGFAWVPTWSWSINKKWKGLRREIPWVDRLPTEIIRDHFRFSIAPADLGPDEHARRIIEWLGSEDILMFATDYPHLHTDDLGRVLALMPESMRPKVMHESARQWYRLDKALAQAKP